MADILLTYVGPERQEDPLAMVLGITYLGACLRREGLEVELVDERVATRAELEGAIARARICGFSALSPNMGRALEWGHYARERGKIAIMGGPHATVDPGVFLDSGAFDLVFQGEGEGVIGALARALLAGDQEGLARIPGVAFDRHGERVLRPRPERIEDLDAVPFPARDLLPGERYFAANPDRLVYLFTSRGCPYRCTFCQKELTGRSFRQRSAANIADELEEVCGRYHPGSVLFIDEIFTLKRERIHELCEEIRRRGIEQQWVCNTRADRVDRELLEAMYSAGCRRIYYGWESGSQRILDILQKDLSVKEIIASAKMTRRAGIWAKVFLIVGSPSETLADIRATEQVLRRAHPDLIRVSIFNPLIGTASWQLVRSLGAGGDLSRNYVSSGCSAYRHEFFSQEELEVLKDEMIQRYERWYRGARPRAQRILQRLRFYLEHPRQGLQRLGRAFGLHSGEAPLAGMRASR